MQMSYKTAMHTKAISIKNVVNLYNDILHTQVSYLNVLY